MSARHWELRSAPGEPSSGAAAADPALHPHPIIAALLAARGCTNGEDARRFLHPSLDDLHDPLALPDMELACARIGRAIEAGEKILVFGDYDVDGVCAAALLTRALRTLRANVEARVPHRRDDGYDLQPEAVRRAHEAGVGLIVTVDCGIVAHAAHEAARELGVDVIVTDHHLPGDRLPEAVAVVNPRRRDSTYPFLDLCGTGLAFKLAHGLVNHLGIPSRTFRTAYLDLVALATTADCMPLLGENRELVTHGMERLRQTKNEGLKALMQSAGVQRDQLTTRSLGFALGPRINAVGRLDAAEHALRLLLTDNPAEAQSLAATLEGFNNERQAQQQQILEEAIRQAQRFNGDRILVLASARWHPGVIGIVASKMVDALARPAVLIAIDEEQNSARGSARSIEGFHIFDALSACGSLLLRCGGHAGAAGFDLDPASVEDLRSRLREVAEDKLSEDLLVPRLLVEAELPISAITVELARELAQMEPFGHGNPQPRFMSRALPVRRRLQISAKSRGAVDHLKLHLGAQGDQRLEAIGWRLWNRADAAPEGASVDLCYTLDVNRYNGMESVQLTLEDFRPAEG